MFVVVAAVLFFGSPALAWSPKLEVDENAWMQIGFLGQLQFETVENAAGTDNNKWSSEFFVRRARILAQGSVHEKVKFFFDTDLPNSGKTGAPNTLIWNDGIIDLQFAPEINVSMGRILPPSPLKARLPLQVCWESTITLTPSSFPPPTTVPSGATTASMPSVSRPSFFSDQKSRSHQGPAFGPLTNQTPAIFPGITDSGRKLSLLALSPENS